MRTSIITLVFIKDDRKILKNYRPISLLCADYKIVAKIFAERMKSVLPTIIHPDQTGFVPHRNINENIMTFLEVQEYMQNPQRSGYAFLADIEKAFDSVSREFIERSVRCLNSGDFFISWFIILHKDSKARLIINNFYPLFLPFLQVLDKAALGHHHYSSLRLNLWLAPSDRLI
jgi:hypothetical protein